MIGEIDRFVLPLDAPHTLRYFYDALFVPHGMRERMHKLTRRKPRPVQDDSARELFAMLGARANRAATSIILRDYPDSDRQRTMAFLFERDARTPYAIAKAQRTPADPRWSLRNEADAMERARAALPPELRRSVPEVLASESHGTSELLVIEALPGRSAYIDMQASFVPWRYVDAHFAAASRWLADFHLATRSNELSASHGDFWARNFLHDGNSIAVVDWENFTLDTPPHVDLFHYPLTYGLNYAGARLRRVAPERAFTRTFIAPTRVSRAVRRYLADYAQRTNTPLASLLPAFRTYLETEGTMGVARPQPGTRLLPWQQFLAMIDGARGSVFTG
ncbi:MAG: hypothetical protein M3Q69_09515 [Acidobacteriota bacterium]|nr:hypothetical protein [Acidobacteriota bacterium]